MVDDACDFAMNSNVDAAQLQSELFDLNNREERNRLSSLDAAKLESELLGGLDDFDDTGEAGASVEEDGAVVGTSNYMPSDPPSGQVDRCPPQKPVHVPCLDNIDGFRSSSNAGPPQRPAPKPGSSFEDGSPKKLAPKPVPSSFGFDAGPPQRPAERRVVDKHHVGNRRREQPWTRLDHGT